MSALASWFKTVIVGYRRTLTGEQMRGEACALCGGRFTGHGHRKSFGWVRTPLRRHRVYACLYACTVITLGGDVQDLFRAAIPARQNVWFRTLGADDVPLVAAPDGSDTADRAYTDALAAQPHTRVEIAHRKGALTIPALPLSYAEQLAGQAVRLGFAAAIREQAAHLADGSAAR